MARTGLGEVIPARISVHHRVDGAPAFPAAMDTIRFRRISEALTRMGHEVDMVVGKQVTPTIRQLGPRLRQVPSTLVRWDEYDLVKILFHRGMASLIHAGGGDHPFIVGKLGTVVGSRPTPGVHFFGDVLRDLFEIQSEMARRCRYVTVLNEPGAALWRAEHGDAMPLLMVPTGVDARLPRLGPDPYRAAGITGPIVLFAGNIYDTSRQGEVNLIWQDRLNRVGRAMRRRGLTLVAMGMGAVDRLDRSAVIHLGPVDFRGFWDWQRHAQVGLVLAHGEVQDNESSKIYYYLRTALPTVCERPVPNAAMIEEAGCGAVVDLDDPEAMAEAARTLVDDPPHPPGLERRMAREHSWDARARIYAPVISEAVAERPVAGRPGHAVRRAS